MDCIFIGYAHNSNAYRFLVHYSEIPDVHKNTVIESKDASFFEDIFPCKPASSGPSIQLDRSMDETPDVQEIELRRSKRAKVEKSFGDDFETYLLEREPLTYAEAVNSSEAPLWKEAIKSEVDSIMQNHTWELVDLPPGSKPL